ncbi:MAG: oligosaccharide flippase family protein [Myxococcales bacterium]|nr:oligosaccharide flippase family protein [Myxococcales bacterium]
MTQPDDTQVARANARAQMKKGFAWFGSSALVVRLVELASTLVILRLLTKEDFGRASVVLSIILIVEALSGAGLGTSIVQAPELSHRQINSLFWLCILVACALGLIIATGAPFVTHYYGDSDLKTMMWAGATKMLPVGAAVVPLQLLARDLRFRESSLVQAGATLLEALTRVSLAMLGMGAWALILANVARGVFLCTLVFIVKPVRPQAHFSKSEVEPFIQFGIRAAMASFLTQCYRHVDYLLVGKFLGLSAAGLYRVAYEIALTAVEVVTQLVNRVVYPVFSTVNKENKELLPVFFYANRYLWIVLSPIIVLVFFNPEPIIMVFAGPQWVGAATATKLLSWAALFHATCQQFSMLFYARGRADYVMSAAFVTLLAISTTMVGALVLLPRLYIASAGLAWLVSYPIVLIYLFGLTKRLLPFKISDYLRNIAPVAGALLIMAISIQIILWVLARYVVPELVAAGISSVIGITAFVLALRYSPNLNKIRMRFSN